MTGAYIGAKIWDLFRRLSMFQCNRRACRRLDLALSKNGVPQVNFDPLQHFVGEQQTLHEQNIIVIVLVVPRFSCRPGSQ